ncbi:conserved hypothetical protein [uncultured Defluviicoccus sp.]|uniref:Uncharacterized protein n=1 Tax=metagenome TaxID=256318 RepID=A0A380TB84_9ZZZZ|nr:conserved hypothetical protein [uncultured Defluviicoccus sp.]
MARPPEQMNIIDVACLGADHACLAGFLFAWDPEEPRGRLALYERGTWSRLGDTPEFIRGLAVLDETDGAALYVLLRNGVIHRFAGSEHSAEVIEDQRNLGFRGIDVVGRHLYAYGMGHQVFRREDGRWLAIDEGLFDGDPFSMLNSIHGHSERDIYAGGTGGSIFHFDGRRWQRLESPTTYGIEKILCVGGETYACGFNGTLFRGDRDGWETLAVSHGEARMKDMAFCFDRLYVASADALYTLEGDQLETVSVRPTDVDVFGFLSYRDGQLWSGGGERLIRFDGETWTEVLYPPNQPV